MKKVITATLVALVMTGANADGVAQKYGLMSSANENTNTSKTVVMVAGAVAGSALGYAIMAESGAGIIAKVGIGSLVGITGARVGEDIYKTVKEKK